MEAVPPSFYVQRVGERAPAVVVELAWTAALGLLMNEADLNARIAGLLAQLQRARASTPTMDALLSSFCRYVRACVDAAGDLRRLGRKLNYARARGLAVRGRTGEIREALLALDIPHLHMYPSVYIDGEGGWHQDYWYLCFVRRFDCWDKDKSRCSPDPIEVLDEKLYGVFSDVLDDRLLDTTPLAQRLLFMMGGTLGGWLTVHESLLPLFAKHARVGVKLRKVCDH